jgi:hypothetical protein
MRLIVKSAHYCNGIALPLPVPYHGARGRGLTMSAAGKCNVVNSELLSVALLIVLKLPSSGSNNPSPFMDCLTLNKEALLSSELLVIIHQSSRFNIPEGLDLQVQYHREHSWTDLIVSFMDYTDLRVLLMSLLTWTLDNN